MSLQNAIGVVISSTCYDLADLRPELGQTLAANGFIVRMSEDPNSGFVVEPTDDSISSCLANVEASDVVVCIIDRRYGGVLKAGPYKELSATHAEIRHARSLSPAKPVFFFVRQVAFQEYGLVKEVASYPMHQNWSNWCDQFQNSIDLKTIVLKRLLDKFPGQPTVLGMRPDRIVRLSFTQIGQHQNGIIRGYYYNVGNGPAINLRHGFRRGNEYRIQEHSGGLAVGQHLGPGEGITYSTDEGHGNLYRALFVSYENTNGDRYRVEVPIERHQQLPRTTGPERFFVGPTKAEDDQLIQVV